MISVTIRAVLEGDADGVDGCIYVVRDRDVVFYVGQSRRGAVERVRDHLGIGSWSWAHGLSALGYLVRGNLPASLAWQVDVMTLEDCVPYVRGRVFSGEEVDALRSFFGRGPCFDGALTVDEAERALIRHYRPCLNGTHNPDAMCLPKRYVTEEERDLERALEAALRR